MKAKGGLVAIVIGVLIAIITIGSPLYYGNEPSCGGKQMSPGDMCVDWKYGSRTYEQAQRQIKENRRVVVPIAFVLSGLFIAGGAIRIGYVRRRISAAVAEQRRTPRPDRIGRLICEYPLDDDRTATLYEEGIGATDRYGVTRWALWDDVEDIEVSTTSGAQRGGEIVREPRHHVTLRLGDGTLSIDGAAHELGEFVQQADGVLFERTAKRIAEALLRGESFQTVADSKVWIDGGGVIRRGRRGDRRLSWSEVTPEVSDDRFVHLYQGTGKIIPWSGFSAKTPRGAACLAVVEKLRRAPVAE